MDWRFWWKNFKVLGIKLNSTSRYRERRYCRGVGIGFSRCCSSLSRARNFTYGAPRRSLKQTSRSFWRTRSRGVERGETGERKGVIRVWVGGVGGGGREGRGPGGYHQRCEAAETERSYCSQGTRGSPSELSAYENFLR